MAEFTKNGNALVYRSGYEILKVEPWGRNGVRVRATKNPSFREDWIGALLDSGENPAGIEIHDSGAGLRNGILAARIGTEGELSFWNHKSGEELLREQPVHSLTIPARHYRELQGGLYRVETGFRPHEGERLFGLGQHQHGRLDQKGCVVDLIQRNTEVAVPFVLSSRGYGFLWNNPAVGRVELGRNATRWVAEACPQLDYWITADDDPKRILANYADVTGHAPMLPEWAAGFWQCKLRYASQAELEAVAEEYSRRKLPLSVLVIDFFHWTRQGDWRFDPHAWPDPAAMVRKLEKLGVKVMVSVWPTVNRHSPAFEEMRHSGFILRNKAGSPAHSYFTDIGDEDGTYVHFYDSTNPAARKCIWEKVKRGYYLQGIKTYWLDACEPEIVPFHPENLEFYCGDGSAVANAYPLEHVRGFYEGMRAEGEEEILFLCRSAWAGSQRFGAAVWSGDISSSFEALRAQVPAGLNMALSGIPWWTTDIGGFHGGDGAAPEFRELIVRWFQYGAFCPLFRLHGHRLPNADIFHGGPNEVWSFGEEAYAIFREYLMLRERLRPYILDQMRIAHETGLPPMRPLFVDFPSDADCWAVEDEYLFGLDLLVAPVLDAGARSRRVYLPAGSSWKNAWTDQPTPGGRWIDADAPLERIPLFLRGNAALPIRGG
ncbi:MAG: glycoside hydrolase family 31 protein [Anaerolineales bacterium]|nr:glycoside hydrolase family 31 protein [Anaerolineales bacterium]